MILRRGSPVRVDLGALSAARPRTDPHCGESTRRGCVPRLRRHDPRDRTRRHRRRRARTVGLGPRAARSRQPRPRLGQDPLRGLAGGRRERVPRIGQRRSSDRRRDFNGFAGCRRARNRAPGARARAGNAGQRGLAAPTPGVRPARGRLAAPARFPDEKGAARTSPMSMRARARFRTLPIPCMRPSISNAPREPCASAWGKCAVQH